MCRQNAEIMNIGIKYGRIAIGPVSLCNILDLTWIMLSLISSRLTGLWLFV